MSSGATAAAQAPAKPAGVVERIRDNIRAGNLGSWPVVIVLLIIVVYFSFTADNFFTAVNFNNIIVQMAGGTMLAYGVVFVLLIGEIDLSISYISGIAGVVVAELTLPEGSVNRPFWAPFHVQGIVAILIAIGVCAVIGAGQGSIVALIGVPSFVVTLAGFEVWQGVIQNNIPQGVIVIQDHWVNDLTGYFFSDLGGWLIAIGISAVYAVSVLTGVISSRRHGVPVRDPLYLVLKVVAVAAAAFITVGICNSDRGVPFALLLIVTMLLVLTFLSKRLSFGRHVYAVGGSAEAARRAGINVARIRILVFGISGAMAGLGGVMLASRLSSVDLGAGGGTLLLDAIAAAVIGGTSLFGGRGEVRNALFGALVIYVIANGLNTQSRRAGTIYIVTGLILLFAVTLDTVLRRRQAKAGR